MRKQRGRRQVIPQLEALERRQAPSATPVSGESFDTTPVGTLPAGWSQWTSIGPNAFAVSSAQSHSPPNSLAAASPTAAGLEARSWLNTPQPANVQVSAEVLLNTDIPAEILARGTALDTTTPSYYAVSLKQGNLFLTLQRVDHGIVTTLGQVRSTSWFANQWASVTLFANENNLRAQVQRNDNGQYLNSFGQWQTSPTWAMNLTDTALTSGGEVGLGRLPSSTGTVYFDDFAYSPVTLERQPPTVTINAPAASATVSGLTRVQVSATDDTRVTSVEFYVDNVLRAAASSAPYTWNLDTTMLANGPHTLTVKAYDPAQNIGQASETFTSQNDFSPLPRPTVPQHYSHIRLAELAYNGAPSLDPFDDQLLQSSVDLVVLDSPPIYLDHIHSVSSSTPELIYTNVSNIYLGLLVDWLNYADAHGYAREGAFYHVTQATPFSGAGGSTRPVNWFWGVYSGDSTWTDYTWQAHDSSVTFPGSGQSLLVGYPDQFREINLNLVSGASGGWSAVLEYPTAVDSAGNPTAWAPLTTITNTTSGYTQSGQITFDPPADWKPAAINSQARLYYVRFRTLTPGTAPVAKILGRDYVGANGTSSGVIPAFDWTADTDHDGYLNDAEYANRAPGMNARFFYESRVFSYGQMRFATNPSDAGFRSWAVDYDMRYLNSYPLAAGLFMDNSGGQTPVAAGSVLEPVASYANDYATLLYDIGRAIAPRWMLANTAGGGTNANPTIQRIQGYYEEFAIRPLASSYPQFEGLAGVVANRAALASPASYAVLDSYPQGGSQTDPRTELATLAYYYLLADPQTTFLDFFGGYDTTGPWTRHWSAAAAYDIGQPTGSWSLFATGADPSNQKLTYRVYQRSFTNALVLYKPLSYGNGSTGTLTDASATTFALGGSYYLLQADGTLSGLVTSVTLRNGEGAILVKASVPTSATLSFVDTTTRGNWEGTYGGDGYNVISSAAQNISYPGYAQVSPSGQSTYVWDYYSTDPRALEDPSSAGNRLAGTWYSNQSFSMDVDLSDGQAHRLELYLVDWDNLGRKERVDVLDAQSGAVLASQTVAGFSGGEYLGLTVTGHVILRFTNLAGPNAVLSGLFFDALSSGPSAPRAPTGVKASGGAGQVSLSWTGSAGATSYNLYRGTSPGGEAATPVATGLTTPSYTDMTGLSSGTTYYYQVSAVNAAGQSARSAEASASTASSTSTASFVGADTTTQGNWQGVYGAQGYDLAQVGAQLPSYAQVSLSSQSNWVWDYFPTDARALENPSGGREAATWYSNQSFSMDVDLSDGQAHRLELYLVDWDNLGRKERVDVLDAQSGAVLASQTVAGFSGGEYLGLTVTGHVILRFTNLAGPNAVLSGLFFG